MQPFTNPEGNEHGERIVSPFAEAEPQSIPRRSDRHRSVGWIWGIVLFLIVACAGGYFLLQHLNDPLRTLEPFPVEKYLDSHRALMGSRFKGEMRVEADLGWKPDTGRLMLFSSSNDSRPVAVLIPPSVGVGIYFTKGQGVLAELEVKEGGLIQANSVRKN